MLVLIFEVIDVIFAGVVIKSYKNSSASETFLIYNLDADVNVNLINCYGENVGDDKSITKNGIGVVNVTVYGYSYFNKTYGAGVTVTGNYVTDPALAV